MRFSFGRVLACIAALGLLAGASVQAQENVKLHRMDVTGQVEGDPYGTNTAAFDPTAVRDNAFPFASLGFPIIGNPAELAPPAGFGNFPDFGGGVGIYYFVLPDGVTEIKAVELFDDHDDDPVTIIPACVTGSASFDIFTGPEFHAVTAWNGAAYVNPTSHARFFPGVRVNSLNPFTMAVTDEEYGPYEDPALHPSPFLDPDCSVLPYDNLLGTHLDAGLTTLGLLPRTAGMAGNPDFLLDPLNPQTAAIVGSFSSSIITDTAGVFVSILDCDGDASADTAYAPVYGASPPPGKLQWPGWITVGCGGTITVNYVSILRNATAFGPNGAGADIKVFEVGFAEEPVGAIGSADEVGNINIAGTAPPCPWDGTPATEQCVVISVLNDSQNTPAFQTGSDPANYGFPFSFYSFKLCDANKSPDPLFPCDFGDSCTDQAGNCREYLGASISPGASGSLGTYTVTCDTEFYLYLWGSDTDAGNPDGDGHGEQVFASELPPSQLEGASFLTFTGISTEPVCYKGNTDFLCPGPGLAEAGGTVAVLDGTALSSWNLYAFSNAAAVGQLQTEAAVTIDVDPDTLNLNSGGRWVTVYIETVGDDMTPADLDPSTIRFEGANPEEPVFASARFALGDANGNGSTDLMIKIPRGPLANILQEGPETLITVRGETFDGAGWFAQDTIRVIKRGTSSAPGQLKKP
ncbi:MAG: hypothetical protein O7H41_14585 [Planctomycetota bacterium]|nr:hypothetical protein [Planctomycetota bacterium]